MKICYTPTTDTAADALARIMHVKCKPHKIHIDLNPQEIKGYTGDVYYKLRFAGTFGGIVLELMEHNAATDAFFEAVALKFFLECPKEARKLSKAFGIKTPETFGSRLFNLSQNLKNPEFRAIIESLDDQHGIA